MPQKRRKIPPNQPCLDRLVRQVRQVRKEKPGKVVASVLGKPNLAIVAQEATGDYSPVAKACPANHRLDAAGGC